MPSLFSIQAALSAAFAARIARFLPLDKKICETMHQNAQSAALLCGIQKMAIREEYS